MCTERASQDLMRTLSASKIKRCLVPPKFTKFQVYILVPKSEMLYGVKIMKIKEIKNLPLGHL